MADAHRTGSRPGDAVDRAAAAWFARRDAGMGAVEQVEFERWLAADPRHAEVWREFESSLDRIDSLREAGNLGEFPAELARRERRGRARLLGAGAITLAAAAAVAFLLVGRESPPAGSAASQVVVSKPEQRVLADGSTVELDRGAAIEVDLDSARRTVRLVQGKAHFSVTRDPLRPFVVAAGGVEVRAVGTAFAVSRAPAMTSVVVTHGRVAVQSGLTGSPAAPVMADAGSLVVAGAAQPPTVAVLDTAELDRHLAWRGPRIELSATPLAAAVPYFNRESGVKLAIVEPELAKMRMSGVFRADDAEGFARMLEANYGVSLVRTGDTITLRVAR